MIYLASTSPRRKALLKKAGIRFRILKPDYKEGHLKRAPSQIVQIHAAKKAQSCLRQVTDGIILAADTLVYLKGEMIGKPKNLKEAHLILRKLQGKRHAVYTGVALLKVVKGRVKKRTVFYERTQVCLKALTGAAIKSYFKKVDPLDKAGAYAIQSRRGGIIQKVIGPFSNAVGLPLEKTLKKLRRI